MQFSLPGSLFRQTLRSRTFQFLIASILATLSIPAHASLNSYDAIVQADQAAGLAPTALLTNALAFNDVNKAPFNFGTNSGDVTMEFIVSGDPVAGGPNGYLAVGTNTSSSLRYEQWNNTGQLGFTQLGFEDYLFLPGIPSPTQTVHIAYVWQAPTRTMKLYLNGSVAGTRPNVVGAFTMPYGQGWLGNAVQGTEGMVGTIFRVTVYDDSLTDETLQRHADAYNGIVRPPVLVSFTAAPEAIFTPATATLSWDVRNALAVFINGTEVTGLPGLNVTPSATTTYSLVATNVGGSVTGRVTVVVNPVPDITRFAPNKAYVAAGETITLSWIARFGDSFSIAPGVGDVTTQTLDGVGSLSLPFTATTTYTLTAANAFGIDTATTTITLAHPANHLVISEFMADNESVLADEDGDYSDWIEIYNPTANAVSLAGWFLTDDKSNPTNWAFPPITLAAGAHQLVFASGKNRANAGGPLHANFQLDKAGEFVALVGPGAVFVHVFDPFPPQEGNVSFGVLSGDLSLTRFMGVPTPGAFNDDTPASPAEVRFSRASGTFTGSFSLTLTCDTPGAEIRYTLDDSVPGPTNGTIYNGPITVNGTTRVRTAALSFGLSGKIASAGFIKLAPDLANYTSSLPILVIENFGAGLIPQKGWTTTGAGIKQVLRQSAVWATFERESGISAMTNPPQMFNRIGIRGRGAYSSSWPQKPYSVEALDEKDGELAVSPLGLPAHPDWVLYFPFPGTGEPALIFNTFAYELYQSFGRKFAVKFRWVEAFVNEDGGDLKLSDRRGVYAIIEKVSRGKDRLDFQKLSDDGANGGWLLSLNRMDPEPENGWPAPNGTIEPQFFHTAGPNRILQTPPNAQVVGDDEPQQFNGYLNFDNPNGYVINTNQRAAIEGWFKKFEDVLWNNAIWRDPTNGYRKYLDEEDFADYFLLNTLTRNGDGLLISMFPWKGDDDRLRMGPAWDYNPNSYYQTGENPASTLLHRPDRLWYRRLFDDVDFNQLYIDRWWLHRRGTMSNAGIDAIIDRQVAEISAEKAVLNGFANSNEWATNITKLRTWLKVRADWIDGNYVRPPTFNQDGGDVPDGFQVTILGTNGAIYFTTDGSDPRAPLGAVATSAQGFLLPFPITAQTLVQARIRSGANWSGLTAAHFFPPQDMSKLVVTEVMYHPPTFGALDGDEVEFLELKNSGTNLLNLGGLTFNAGLTFVFTNGTRLGPGQFIVLARNAAAFQAKYPGVPLHGIYSGRLDNAGETLRLATQLGNTVFSLNYDDRTPWPVAADGHGFSVVPKVSGANANSDNGAHWRASSAVGGSPAADDPEPVVPFIVINELRSNGGMGSDFIELFNPTLEAVNLGGWFLTDDPDAPKKFRIPDGTTITDGGYVVFNEAQFNPAPGLFTSFGLSPRGGTLYLFSADAAANLTGYSHGLGFGASLPFATFGRHVISTGEEQFPTQLSESFGGVNPGPQIGPVVITEIHYHPDAGGDEFIELQNIHGSVLPLQSLTNTWRVNGLGFDFPTNVVLVTNQLVLIVATNPAAFRAKYQVSDDVLIFGPFSGNLQDSGERLELQRPELMDTNGYAFVTVDEVRYNDRAPWPPAADGSGASLQRVSPLAYSNDPANWEAATPTPGRVYVSGQTPAVVAQPQGQNVLSYQDAPFGVTATGAAPLNYQWLFNGDPIAGATNASLLLTNVQPWQAGDYAVAIYNNFGSVISMPAQLTVNRVPTILANPTNQFVRPGLNATFRVSAVGNGPLRYQWRLNGANLTDATNAILTVTNSQFSSAGAYSVVVMDNVGPVISAPAQLVLLINPIIVQPPLSQVAVPGGTVTLSVIVTNTANLPIGYLWRTNSRYFQTNFLNSHTAFLTITNARPPFTNYAVVVTNLAQNFGLLSAPAILTYVIDTDGDGIPDDWELANGFATNNVTDAALDPDGDTMSNRSEYIAGTDPNDPASYLKIDSVTPGMGSLVTFGAVSNRTYSLQFTDALNSSPWQKLVDLPARAFNRTESIPDLTHRTNRFYRVMTPQRP